MGDERGETDEDPRPDLLAVCPNCGAVFRFRPFFSWPEDLERREAEAAGLTNDRPTEREIPTERRSFLHTGTLDLFFAAGVLLTVFLWIVVWLMGLQP